MFFVKGKLDGIERNENQPKLYHQRYNSSTFQDLTFAFLCCVLCPNGFGAGPWGEMARWGLWGGDRYQWCNWCQPVIAGTGQSKPTVCLTCHIST